MILGDLRLHPKYCPGGTKRRISKNWLSKNWLSKNWRSMAISIHGYSDPWLFRSMAISIHGYFDPCLFRSMFIPIHVYSDPCLFRSMAIPIHGYHRFFFFVPETLNPMFLGKSKKTRAGKWSRSVFSKNNLEPYDAIWCQFGSQFSSPKTTNLS